MIEISGPPWCICEACETCEHSIWCDGKIVDCTVDGKAHHCEDACDSWQPCEYEIETCDAGPCATCDARAWWDKKADYWMQRLGATP